MILGMMGRQDMEVDVEEVEDGDGVEVVVVVVAGEEEGPRNLIVRRRIRGRSRIKPVGRIIIGASSERRRLRVEVVCLVDEVARLHLHSEAT